MRGKLSSLRWMARRPKARGGAVSILPKVAGTLRVPSARTPVIAMSFATSHGTRSVPATLRSVPATLRRAGFSLVEVLMATMILGVGLIMIASVFPVGATWTRQNAEETVAGFVSRNAVAIIRTKYVAADFKNVSTTLVSVMDTTVCPNVAAKLPFVERAYDFGRTAAYPAANNGAGALYCWTAMIRKSGVDTTNGGLPPGTANSYDLYILVFKKGVVEQTFVASGTPLGRDEASDPKDGGGKALVPYLIQGTVLDAPPAPAFPVGSQAIDPASGTVFRKIAKSGTMTNLNLTPANAIYAPAADGASVSPLVFIYTTTISF